MVGGVEALKKCFISCFMIFIICRLCAPGLLNDRLAKSPLSDTSIIKRSAAVFPLRLLWPTPRCYFIHNSQHNTHI